MVRCSESQGAPPPAGLGGPVRVEHVDGDHFAVTIEGERVAAFVEDALAETPSI